MRKPHSFHIPVMGIGYTIDTPLKVSHLGIDSIISLVDDILIEKIRKLYCDKLELPYQEISDKIDDFRAKRITSYLNMLNEQAERKFEEFKSAAAEKKDEIKEFFHLLPCNSKLKEDFKNISEKYLHVNEIKSWLNDNLSIGSIDVNIMTKVDRENFKSGEKLPVEFNDAHAALRGFAQSNLSSSVILSAGMNPRLYSYIEQFEDFFPNEAGVIKKKIVLKVSDYKSALIQGKFFAKKGLWVSEYRIESGLNCGGHAFATEGYLLGPILAEFRDNKTELVETIHELLIKTLKSKNRVLPNNTLSLKITAQGGVGTSEEHDFLLEHYGVDSVGWGSPFLLVPEATTVDENTLDRLALAKESDIYLSNISPLGVPFNSLKGNTKDVEKLAMIEKGKPGSACPKRYAALSNEFTEQGLCTASSRYQRLKIKELEKEELEPTTYKTRFNEIVEKSCTCVGLGTSAMIAHNMDTKTEGIGVSVCPGPNMAYFSKVMSLKEITDHIYGRMNMISRNDRPNMFMKELDIYLEYLKNKLEESKVNFSKKQEKYFLNFSKNLNEGIGYYSKLFGEMKDKFSESKQAILKELDESKLTLNFLHKEIENKSGQ